MGTLQRFLSVPFAFHWFRGRVFWGKQRERQTQVRHQGSAEEPHYSKRFRLERECAEYRSVHFPR